MKSATALLISFSALLTFTAGSYAESNPEHVDTKEMSFTFPDGFAKPTHKTQPIQIRPGEEGMEDIWEAADTNGVSIGISTITFKNMDITDAHTSLVGAKNELVEKAEATITNERFFTQEGLPGIEFDFSVPDPSHHCGRERIMTKLPRKRYVVALLAPANYDVNSQQINQSFDSFKVK